MVTVHDKLSVRKQIRQPRRTHEQLRAERLAEERAGHEADVRYLTQRYARILRVRSTGTIYITPSLFGLPLPKVLVKPLSLKTDGHWRDIYLDRKGRYWVSMNVNGKPYYYRRRLEDFEPWELTVLAPLLQSRIGGMYHF